MYARVDKDSQHCWRFRPSQLADSPSRRDGVCARIEAGLRRAGCALICAAAERLFDVEWVQQLPLLILAGACALV